MTRIREEEEDCLVMHASHYITTVNHCSLQPAGQATPTLINVCSILIPAVAWHNITSQLTPCERHVSKYPRPCLLTSTAVSVYLVPYFTHYITQCLPTEASSPPLLDSSVTLLLGQSLDSFQML